MLVSISMCVCVGMWGVCMYTYISYLYVCGAYLCVYQYTYSHTCMYACRVCVCMWSPCVCLCMYTHSQTFAYIRTYLHFIHSPAHKNTRRHAFTHTKRYYMIYNQTFGHTVCHEQDGGFGGGGGGAGGAGTEFVLGKREGPRPEIVPAVPAMFARRVSKELLCLKACV